MPYTSHGHAYGVIDADQPRPRSIARCGGPRLCKKCAAEAASGRETEATATEGTLFGKPVRLAWPEGPPLGLSRQEIGEKLGSTIMEPNTIVLRDRNGNPMNMSVTCSCGKAMLRDSASTDYDPTNAPGHEKTAVVCKGCGNRLIVTVPFGSPA